MFFLPTPTQGVGGERSETEGGISAMVNDGGCPFLFRMQFLYSLLIEDFFMFIL